MGRTISYLSLCNKLQEVWDETEGFALMNLGRDYFLAKFWKAEDFQKILKSGPLYFYGAYFHIWEWDSSFDAATNKVKSLTVWARMPGLPVHYYNKGFLRHIGQLLGRVVQIDH
ncbi:OLC1v1036005C1 [Oldenlandia corymbosa var. corymbosa]|uniref:OLC1v1036005C1 n=1 Tax=Oldenlandia corymbosa var. corymbosa TaxID=529605 RepID=A0AAV1CUF0_OLDCO|nr:OLC1v1036005C1 [Oldenlandia corymbosa var. corymbosa]